jgi:Rho termination factor, N-terminal domain
MEVARRLDISGRSTMTKNQLVDAIKKANRRVSSANR